MREKVHKFKHKFVHNLRSLFFLILFFALVGWLYFFVYQKPSNNRDWDTNSAIIPQVEIQQDKIKVSNLRDTKFNDKNEPTQSLIEKTFDPKKITKVYFVVEPFQNKPFTNFKGIAHTYFVFDFADQDPVSVSVEARREKGEKYDSWWGLLNQYELIYTWGTEQNQTVRRVLSENNTLFMYPLEIPNSQGELLFRQLAKSTHELETTPRFYNSLLSNCTNELAKNANEIAPGSIPQNIALYLPGYSASELYKLKLIPTNIPLEDLIKKSNITEYVRTHPKDPTFSKSLRDYLK